MTNKESFEFRSNIGLTSGFANLFYMEISRWWKSKDWIFQIVLWSVIINISLLSILTQNADELEIVTILGLFYGMFPSIAVVIIMQDVIIGEREAGTVQWILSKPCSRFSFILSKIISNSIGVIVSMVFIPGIIAFIMIVLMSGITFDLIGYFLALVTMSLLLIFYLTLTIMLGTLSKQRGLAIGLPLLFNFGIMSILSGARGVFSFVPHGLFFPISTDYSIFSSLILLNPVETIFPFIITIGFSLIFITISIVKFNNEEF